MQLFGAPFSPFVRKALLVAAEKGIALEPVNFSFANPPEDFLAASPFRKIPALKDGDYMLADSTAICTYFEAIAPNPPLLPADAKARGRAIWFEEVADTIMVPAIGPAIFNRFVRPRFLGEAGDEAEALAAIEKFAATLDYLESVVPAGGWLAGDFSIGDIAVATIIRTLDYIDAQPDAKLYPAVAAWYARVAARPAWRKVAADEDAALKAFA